MTVLMFLEIVIRYRCCSYVVVHGILLQNGC
jgi:hypothetical protein